MCSEAKENKIQQLPSVSPRLCCEAPHTWLPGGLSYLCGQTGTVL